MSWQDAEANLEIPLLRRGHLKNRLHKTSSRQKQGTGLVQEHNSNKNCYSVEGLMPGYPRRTLDQRIASQYPVECVAGLVLMVQGDRDNWVLVGVEEEAQKTIREAGSVRGKRKF